jgi:hypothetical protein
MAGKPEWITQPIFINVRHALGAMEVKTIIIKHL